MLDTPSRGRPRTITRERIVDAGIQVGLSNISFVNVATLLGVSHMALYKRISSLEELKLMIAEEIFSRWLAPELKDDGSISLKNHLISLSSSLQCLVKENPGLTPYLLRRTVTTQPMMAKIHSHQRLAAHVYNISEEQARWLFATVAFHSIAGADTLYAAIKEKTIVESDLALEESEIEAEFAQGMYALIIGSLTILKDGLPIIS